MRASIVQGLQFNYISLFSVIKTIYSSSYGRSYFRLVNGVFAKRSLWIFAICHLRFEFYFCFCSCSCFSFCYSAPSLYLEDSTMSTVYCLMSTSLLLHNRIGSVMSHQV